MQAQVLKWGNSLAIRIPRPIADDAHLQLGDPLEIAVAADGVVQVHRVGELPTLAQFVARPRFRWREIAYTIPVHGGPAGFRCAGNWRRSAARSDITSRGEPFPGAKTALFWQE